MADAASLGVRFEGLVQDPFWYGWNLASGITADDVGKAVTLDTSAAKTVKLAGDGDEVIGRLEVFENRATLGGGLVGTVSHHGAMRLPVISTGGADVPAVGDTVVGSTEEGRVKKATDIEYTDSGSDTVDIAPVKKWYVVEVADDDSYVVVVRL